MVRMDAEMAVVLAVVVVASAAAVGVAIVLRRRVDAPAGRIVEPDLAAPPRDAPPPGRPWWGNPWLWLVVAGAFLVLGVVVWPGLFGGTFVFLPFVWVWRPRRRRTVDPRTNGHGSRGGAGTFSAS
jgi:hypothetical protein